MPWMILHWTNCLTTLVRINSVINLTILGSTGSIGSSTLQVIALHPQRFRVFALTAQRNVDVMLTQCLQYQPRYAVMRDVQAAEELTQRLKPHALATEVLAGDAALVDVASHREVDYVMAAIVGAAGLLPTLAAAQAGKRILLANKEALVMSGQLLMDAVRTHNATLLPVDSEHSAIFQCLPANFKPGMTDSGVRSITLTASGGAFRDLPIAQLDDVTPEQACQHPNWNMGAKITVDSATMMNKGLEVIEASWLFGLLASDIHTVLHRQSVIHSWVDYVDGSTLAQLGLPDMRTPIAYALSWPERMASGVQGVDLFKVGRLDFEPLSFTRYPVMELAYAAFQAGGTAATLLNAANEVAVQAFLQRQIRFTDIARLVAHVLNKIPSQNVQQLEDVLTADQLAREEASRQVAMLV